MFWIYEQKANHFSHLFRIFGGGGGSWVLVSVRPALERSKVKIGAEGANRDESSKVACCFSDTQGE